MQIDAHHHFWRYNPREYGWIADDMEVIRRDFLPEDLHAEIFAAGIDGVISVQARQTLEETKWLLELATKNDFILGVVGWVDLRAEAVGEQLNLFAANPKLKSVRHVVQGEPDEQFLLRPEFERGIHALRRHDLAYDILVFARQLPQVIAFVDRHPDQTFVVDHLAKPRIRDGGIGIWTRDMMELGRRPHVFVKLSGLVTEAAHGNWTPEQLRPYLDHALEIFGPHRLMFGSDWPVCLVATDYPRWFAFVESCTQRLTVAERERVLGGTAAEVYRL